ncbi:anti-phage defense-associated sirtuin Dsr1 [Microbulbifer halophilus]|uniref:Anti-phage defense-associated sirtuin Dsr1 n=1 Tax=Microbulbifer halophilus TaxID=453963 RepID=A0ABW5EA14_9GAMM|nr:anti-phage defense-associated sirtuin Dsr1 [Microbulbifer halophilus]MCW8127556.1 SIR2 family protein [Microbulbifer halophilus]
MQFVRGGPDIPERLLEAHEEGRVVFFCGAGISYPARLPGFYDLVTKLYASLAPTPSAVQEAAIKAGQLDTAVGLLESEIVGGRERVRLELANILTPDLGAPNSTATHEALLTLGKCRDGRTRLITTNFDRLFEEAISRKSLQVDSFQAPLLPVPKNRWDGLVYLHGLLSTEPTPSELDRLIISSGDFGLAYLSERWAARFVSELFRNYIVCFVGYSINDPVLRYMTDALAADRLLGESPPEMFAFGNHPKGQEEKCANEWGAKNVTPILYRNHNRHSYLHKTLRAWAETYRDGVQGKERIVVEFGMARPMESTQQDNYVGRMLWALSDPSGLPAKRFADLDPVPPLDWLKSLSEARYCHTDLSRFGVPPQTNKDGKLAFSLIHRPSPYTRSPWMALVGDGRVESEWDNVMSCLALWLSRHLNDPRLLHWLVNRGVQLSIRLLSIIENRLDKLEKLEREGDTDELTRIRESAPNAIPSPMMRKLWRLLVTGHVKSSRVYNSDLYRWRHRFKHEGFTPTLRLQLREMLTPRVSLRKPFRWPEEDDETREPENLRDLVEWEIVLPTDHTHSRVQDLREDDNWIKILPELLPDFTSLLRDALDLMHELGGADNRSDLSYMHQPSISEHSQNKDFHDWTVLINLTRDAWLATAAQSPRQAQIAVENWRQISYPLFRRLILFAATQDDVIPTRLALDWLLEDGNWWLWSVETEREALRLLVALAPKLDDLELGEVEQAILVGPPREMFKEDADPLKLSRINDREVWLRLAKLDKGGAALTKVGKKNLDALSAQYSEWELTEDQRDEFPYWVGSAWVGDRAPWQDFVPIPRTRRGLLNYLIENPVLDESKHDDWRKRCDESFQATAYALCYLAKQNVWPQERWRDALQAWSDEELHSRSWQYIAPVLVDAPDSLMQAISHSVSRWLQTIAKTFEGHERYFFTLVRRILALDYQKGDSDDPVSRAINHPVGHVTEALLDWWYRSALEDGQGLSEQIKPIFTELCDTQFDKYRHGRVLLATHVIALFRVDRGWAEQYLLPLFNWENSEIEARAAWEGFLWSPRLYHPLFEAIKPAFLDTAHHFTKLGKHDGQYASLLTFAALNRGDTFTIADLAGATRALPKDGLLVAAQALAGALESAGDQRTDYWENRVVPYLDSIWPNTRDNASPAIAERLGNLCIAARDSFDQALGKLHAWLQPVAHPDFLIHKLHEADLCHKFPQEALGFLSLVVEDQMQWLPSDLNSCLEAVRESEPALQADPRFQRLMELLRRLDGG